MANKAVVEIIINIILSRKYQDKFYGNNKATIANGLANYIKSVLPDDYGKIEIIRTQLSGELKHRVRHKKERTINKLTANILNKKKGKIKHGKTKHSNPKNIHRPKAIHRTKNTGGKVKQRNHNRQRLNSRSSKRISRKP